MSNRLDDGFSTTVTFSLDAAVKLWEKDITPPGIQGGGSIETTTMRNEEWRTFIGKGLNTLSEMTMTCAYATEAYFSLLTMVRKNQEITVNFPDRTTLEFWGFLDSFVPGQLQEGSQPTATCTIIPTNQNLTGAEVAPTWTEAPVGTTVP